MRIKIVVLLICFGFLAYSQNAKASDIAKKVAPIQDATGFSSDQIVLPFPWPNKKCCNTHNIIAVDNSGSMSGLSWSQAYGYVNSIWPTSDYISFYTFNNAVANNYVHALSPVFSWSFVPGGGTNFNSALNYASSILNQYFPDRTCIYFVTDGYFSISPTSFTNFLNALASFKKRTGCPVCIKCIETKWSWTSQSNPTFRKFCDKIGASFTTPGIIKMQYAKEFLARSQMTLDEITKVDRVFAQDYKLWQSQEKKDQPLP